MPEPSTTSLNGAFRHHHYAGHLSPSETYQAPARELLLAILGTENAWLVSRDSGFVSTSTIFSLEARRLAWMTWHP
jgi:hypothetical protein